MSGSRKKGHERTSSKGKEEVNDNTAAQPATEPAVVANENAATEITFTDLHIACKKGGTEIGELIETVLERQPELLFDELEVAKASLMAMTMMQPQPTSTPLEDLLKSAEKTSVLVEEASTHLAESQASMLEQKLSLNLLVLEMLNAMFRHVLSHGSDGDSGLTSKFVAELREHCSQSDKLLLDGMRQWSTATYREYGRTLVVKAGLQAQKVLASTAHAEDKQHADADRVQRLETLRSLTRENSSTSLATGIAELITSSEFLELGLDNKYVSYLPEVFIDLSFDDYEKLGRNTNASLIEIAKRLEICVAGIIDLTDRILQNHELAFHQKLLLLHRLQNLNALVLKSKRHLANEMYQRLHYLDPTVIANLGKTEDESATYDCPYHQMNVTKYATDKSERFWPVNMATVRRFASTVREKSTTSKSSKHGIDTLTGSQIAKYMICIADGGDKQQKESLRLMIGKVEDHRMHAIVELAREKKIVVEAGDEAHFRSEIAKFLGHSRDNHHFKACERAVSLCRYKIQYDALMKLLNGISSSDFREIACQFIISDELCSDYKNMVEFLKLISTIETNNNLKDVHMFLLNVMEKFNPVSIEDTVKVIKACADPRREYGHGLVSMFFMNCLENQKSIFDFMYTCEVCSIITKDNPFLYVLYNYMERSVIKQIFDNRFGKQEGMDDAVLEDVVKSQVNEKYIQGMNMAAGYLSKVMAKMEHRELCVEQIISYVVCVYDIVDDSVSPEKKNIEEALGDFMLFSSAVFALHQSGFRDLAVAVLNDKINSVSAVLNTGPGIVRARGMLLQLMVFIASSAHLEFGDTHHLVHSTFGLYRALKTAQGITTKEKISLLSAAGAILAEAAKSPVDQKKVEGYLKTFLKIKGAKIVSEQYEAFKSVLLTCMPSHNAEKTSESSIAHARNPALSSAAPAKPSADASEFRKDANTGQSPRK